MGPAPFFDGHWESTNQRTEVDSKNRSDFQEKITLDVTNYNFYIFIRDEVYERMGR